MPPGYEISFDYYQFNLPGSQVLTGYPEDAAVLDVPAGIDAVDLLSFDSIVFDQVILPASVTVLNIVAFGGQEVRQAWQVDEGDPVYPFFAEGMLLGAREDAAIIGVPTSKRSSSSVHVPGRNAVGRVAREQRPGRSEAARGRAAPDRPGSSAWCDHHRRRTSTT